MHSDYLITKWPLCFAIGMVLLAKLSFSTCGHGADVRPPEEFHIHLISSVGHFSIRTVTSQCFSFARFFAVALPVHAVLLCSVRSKVSCCGLV